MPAPQIIPMSPLRYGSFADTRRWAFFSLGARMCARDTGRMHGPSLEVHEPQLAAQLPDDAR
jgi:hypothetical protein